jgi:hypothetical protein
MQYPFDPINDRLHVIRCTDRLPGTTSHDARGRYVENYWLTVLGPSTTWLLRHLAGELESAPDGFVMDLEECALRIGLSAGTYHSPFSRAMRRLVKFDLARYPQPTVFAVRTVVPSLARRHVARLPAALRSQHDLWLRHERSSEYDESRSSV